MSDRANKNHRAALHERHASTRSPRMSHVARRASIDEIARPLLAERAWTRRSVLGVPVRDRSAIAA